MRKYFNHSIKKAIIVQNFITIESLDVSSAFSYPEEIHAFYEFAYIDSGAIVCNLETETIHLKQGDFLLIPPKKRHFYSAAENRSAAIFIVCFQSTSEFLPLLCKKNSLDGEMKRLLAEIVKESKSAFQFPFNKKLQLLKKPQFGAQQMVENHIEELLIRLIRNELKENTQIQFVSTGVELENSLVRDIVALLKENLYEKISLEQISIATYYSKTYLNTIFKKNMGHSIMQYYSILKIQEAKKLLRENVSPTAVSNRLCFDSPTYFTKVFKKYTDMTPSEYKRTIL